MFLLGLLAIDLSPTTYRYQGVSKTGIYLMQKLCAGFKNINFRTRFCGLKFNTALIATCKNATVGLNLSSNLSLKNIAKRNLAESNLICDRFVFIDAYKIHLNLRG